MNVKIYKIRKNRREEFLDHISRGDRFGEYTSYIYLPFKIFDLVIDLDFQNEILVFGKNIITYKNTRNEYINVENIYIIEDFKPRVKFYDYAASTASIATYSSMKYSLKFQEDNNLSVMEWAIYHKTAIISFMEKNNLL